MQPLASASTSPLSPADSKPNWYALHIRAKHEKRVVEHLERQEIQTFLPLVNEIHRWSDRNKVVRVPLFSCYAFASIPPIPEYQVRVLSTEGVLRFVGAPGGTRVADSEIESVRALVSSTARYSACPFLTIGQRVRVRGGSLDGIEGILVARNGSRTVVISVEPIQRSLAVSIDDYSVEAI